MSVDESRSGIKSQNLLRILGRLRARVKVRKVGLNKPLGDKILSFTPKIVTFWV
jgi:hypothetical protein